LSQELTYILDCDGVILDSNRMKVAAVEKILIEFSLFSDAAIEIALNHFQDNFGMSRYWHAEYFFNLASNAPINFIERFLARYSSIVKEDYLNVALCEGVLSFLSSSSAKKYVVSGSDQNELQEVFRLRKLSQHFAGILGSPESKINNVASIINNDAQKIYCMIGDSYADLEAAISNNIQFVFYKPYSLASPRMLQESLRMQCKILESWEDFN
jgi:phosphoglycolate phosphatase-like HAD superfamily hydrolase